RLKPWAWPIWMVARSSTLSSVYDIGAAPYRKGQVLHSVFAAAPRISSCRQSSERRFASLAAFMLEVTSIE
ncbi:hypothetical protein JTM39_32895, partial [Pseudomonas aeruginosa]|nr:hypothetical protein [Pseudomonas aeruginosa]